MKRLYRWLTVLFFITLVGCGADNALTKEQLEIQSKADSAVAEILFDSGLDTKASYNVRKDGHVEIDFIKSVSLIDYTLAVEKMRSHKHIPSVYAEQAGSEVCPL